MRTARHFARDRRAAAAAEFAFILPLMLLLMAGIVEFGRMFVVYDAVNRLASRYATAYADCTVYNPSNTNCTTEQTYYPNAAALKNLAPQLTNAVTVRIFPMSISATGVITVGTSQAPYPYPSSATMTTSESTAATATIYNPGTTMPGVLVTISYTHSLIFFPTLMQNIIPSSVLNISYTVAQRSN